MDIHVYTDGGCSGNPGPGGWGYVILLKQGTAKKPAPAEILAERWGAARDTTNNRMELTAALSALKMLRKLNLAPETVWLYTDSQYLQKGMTEWLKTWKLKGWRTSDKKAVKNQDLWQSLDELAALFPIQWKWVKGHDGNIFNERCDELTQKAIASLFR